MKENSKDVPLESNVQVAGEQKQLPVGAASANCKLCRETPVPSYFGSPRKCSFDESGVFTSEGWNCVTANNLRDFAEQETDESFCIRRDDETYAALWIPPHPEDVPSGKRFGPFRGGGFLAMTWYKNRGRTDLIIRVDPRDGGLPDKAALPLTVREAEAAIENLTLARGERTGP